MNLRKIIIAGKTRNYTDLDAAEIAIARKLGGGGGGGVTIVPWASGTDAEIAAMVAALDAGTLSIAETGWQVGDERVVALSAMAADGVPESHAAQNVTLVIMDSQHFDLSAATAGGDTKDHFVVGMKDCLNEAGQIVDYGWYQSARRNWCNSVFRNAIPSELRPIFKQFKVASSTYNSSSGRGGSPIVYTDDYFALPAALEISNYTSDVPSVEQSATSMLSYYQTSSHYYKTTPTTGYWTRTLSSRYQGYSYRYAMTTGGMSGNTPDTNFGLSPFGCI